MLERVNNEINLCLKRGDRARADALRLLKNALINARIAAQHELSEEECIKIAQKEIKLRVEARDLYAANDRKELADKEEFERKVYSEYVPAQMNDNEISEIIKLTVESAGSEITFAKIMPLVMRAIAGKADGKRVADLVKKYIEGE